MCKTTVNKRFRCGRFQLVDVSKVNTRSKLVNRMASCPRNIRKWNMQCKFFLDMMIPTTQKQNESGLFESENVNYQTVYSSCLSTLHINYVSYYNVAVFSHKEDHL